MPRTTVRATFISCLAPKLAVGRPGRIAALMGALAVVARGSYDLLGLQSYFTAGPKEIRAWTIHNGDTAPKAAGVIHGDFERGFIRAECYLVGDLVQYKNEKSIREAGKLRSEGKDYVMQDGDVVNFLFNV